MAPSGSPAAARRMSSLGVIESSCLGVAAAVWLIPASIEIVAWPSTGPVRVALFAPAARLWLLLTLGLAVPAVLCYLRRGPASVTHDGDRAALARSLAPLLLLWLWTVPYWPWLPDRAPVLLILAGPFRWAIAAVAVARVATLSARSAGWRPALPRLSRGAVFVTTLGVYAGLGVWSLQSVGIGGDEPHYLIITHSLLADRDLQIENNHRRADYGSFFNGELPPDYLRRGVNGAIYSIHAPGLPALLLPAYAIGGVRAAIVVMCLLGALAAVAVFDVATRLGGSAIGLATWVSVCFTVPWVPFSWSLFPEMAATAIVAGAVRWLVDSRHDSSGGAAPAEREKGPYLWLWRGTCLAVLPWLHTKFVVLLAALTAFLLLRLRHRLLSAAAQLLPIALSSAAWIAFFYVLYGTPDPTAPYGSYADATVRLANLPRSLFGLLIDQKFGLLVYSPVYLLTIAGAWWMLRDRGLRGLAMMLLLTAAVFVASTGRLYMWWGGTTAPARFLLPALPLVVPMIAVALARVRSGGARATAALLITFSLVVAFVGVLWPQARLLSSDAHGIARLLDAMQGSAPAALALPTFTEVDWHTPLLRLVPWLAAALLAWGLGLFVSRQRTGSSLFWIGAVEATVFVLTGSLLSGPFSAAARAETVRLGRSGLMAAANPDQVRGFDYRRMARLDAAGLLSLSALTLEWRSSGTGDDGGSGGPFSLPPGRYAARVWFDGGGRQRDGDLLLSLGRGNIAARAAGPLGNPATLTFDLPIAVRAALELSDPQTARAARTAEIIPLAIVPEPQRLILPAVAIEPVKDREGAYLVYTDDNTYPEGGVFWTRRTARGRVFVLPAGASQMVLTLHVGPNGGLVRIDAGGERLDTELSPNETRRLSVAVAPGATAVPISVEAPGWFVPADVEPGSRDLRSLGCQVRVELHE
ncbi:MAG: hypothetical protein ABI868_23205 [Acidobacteriota bacterium]